ncbi:hypothetical protein Rhom172_1468 [Rhodothermus marinus SG0.5JP17-172]|uniref:AAA family ATPase n=1 Tax=Rhodothermus marinus TaxID=29549 RepID=UPI000223D854|nr:AAA family ATPase [Rhodothermus marinus]AEN73390.1 hypothetical protein Rhom172_1468 [Rhodothermus marinus SG0.5JP17-172]
MSRIKRISLLRDCGVFRDFQWPKDLPEFGRYNLIYGWNGTGKTTLGRILRCLEKRTEPQGKVKVVIDESEISGDQFPEFELPIRVFNRDFINENVFPVGGGALPPIFVLGEKSVQKQKEVERLKKKRAEAQSKLDSARNTRKKAENELDKFCIDRATVIRDTLRSSGKNRYNNYDKSKFRKDAEEMAAAGDGSTHRLSDDEREKLLAQIHEAPKEKLEEIRYSLPNLEKIVQDISKILQTTVASAAIEALKDDPKLAEWTREGLALHRDRKSDRCLFCEQPLPKDRLAALEAHFNRKYERFLQQIDEKIQWLDSLRKQAAEVRLPHQAELYQDLAKDYDTAALAFKQTLDSVRKFLNELIDALNEKKRQPFKALSLSLSAPRIDAQALDRVNDAIQKHNQACDDFDKRVNEARDKLARHMIAESLEEFIRLKDKVREAEDEEAEAKKEQDGLDARITQLEREIVEHRRPAEDLNEDLRKYLGHDELQLEVKDTGYVITRGGESVETLSEGEMTAIALLYFLKSLQDRQFDLTNGVVVLDDPVSSLDANALYLAFGFIRERTQEAGQLFIFTHNFSFFRQVRNWFHHLKGQRKKDPAQRPARFYMMDCTRDSGRRSTTIRYLDPLLEEYNSEYHYLFARIYRAAHESGPTSLEENYVLPNMARRLLETFLAFRDPTDSGNLSSQMRRIDFDDAKKQRILRFLHTHSHSDAIGEPEHDPSILAEARAVLKDLFDLIESQDKAHFDAMVELVNRQTVEENEE